MDFQLSDEQELLRDTTRDLLAHHYDAERRNQVIETDLGWSRQVWGQLAETGILGLGFDPLESGQLEIMLVLTEIGRRLAPEPVLHAALAPGSIIAEQGTDEQKQLLDEVSEGRLLLAFAHTEPGMRGATATVSTTARADGDAWVLSGRKNPVLAGDTADTLVVTAALPDGGTGLFLVHGDAVSKKGFQTFDGLRGAQIDLDGAPATALGSATDATAAIERALVRIQSALCAEAFGAMEESLRLTSEYLKSRKQFGVTLNTFQTLTQRAADMYVSLELARSMNLYAAMSISDGVLDPTIAARAKLQIARSGRHISQESIQLHGGIGITAEYPIAHYAARLTAIDNTLGSAQDQLGVLRGQVGDYDIAML
ncbi:acyl-CoA dehydrogenase [Mycolicibacterium chitae]|uniref:Acyl-CoA dehydrogenase FadE18_2 n=1 Tax=Mycolicibacterium chitae TaxID=1792 RepID=A0A448IEG2_MYCCI|nr:acyl-CoA dehydrogenase family protein [Mycolicibacterium chitae]MCV7104708.1 acyl-CoA dehydrogenase family protein [Mycolicibacterium chitae]BBZ01911.1 acyl-CoA dehydrogenase [Mycolicibacterium chitae]VEG50738.1 acyl-CoA dehydrogenase FadE18_2 [Mycolicibacterium chitae]